jgi:nanoRNase/pAp phosphatase (c-di-AMP/oligoRNAs hydrolase)
VNKTASEKAPRRANNKNNGKANGRTSKNGVLKHPARLPARTTVLSRFGKVLGKRFSTHNMAILAEAYSAYSGLRRQKNVIRGRGANIFTQWVGDPDALGSAVILKAILEQFGAKEVRILTGTLGHPQNRNLVEKCGIVLHDPNEGRLPRGLNCVVDASPPLGMSNTTSVEPVKELFFVADHHANPEDVEEKCRARGVRRVKLAYVGLPVGSTSAFMAALGVAFELFDQLGPEGRAAAALGIYTDTNDLLHGATPLDFRMFEKLTRNEATRELLDDLRDYRVSEDWYHYRTAAIQNMEQVGNVRVTPMGYLREDHRDVIAEVANDMLRIEETSIALAIGVTERGTEVSVRADSRLLGNDQQRIVPVIEHLLGYVFPGASGFKYQRRPPHRVEGGALVPHDQAQELLVKLAPATPGNPDPAMEHCRKCAHALLTALKDLKFAKPEEIQGIL